MFVKVERHVRFKYARKVIYVSCTCHDENIFSLTTHSFNGGRVKTNHLCWVVSNCDFD